MINIEDFQKINFRIGLVKDIDKNNIKIECNNKNFLVNLKLNVQKGDKIVIGINGDDILIPLVGDDIPIIPEKDIEAGARVR